MSLLKVRVTREDIRKGRAGNCRRCPVARAVRRQGFRGVRVWYDTILTQSANFAMTKRSTRFVRRFDNDQPVMPTTFTLREQELSA